LETSKFSIINRLIILSFVSIIFIAAIPVFFSYKFTGYTVENSIVEFNRQAIISDSLFSGPFAENVPKTTVGFDFEKLRLLSQMLEINIEPLIERIKEPFGSVFISDALSKIIKKMVSRFYQSIFKGYLDSIKILFWLSLLGILIFLSVLNRMKSKLNGLSSFINTRPGNIKELKIMYGLFVITILGYLAFYVFPMIFRFSSKIVGLRDFSLGFSTPCMLISLLFLTILSICIYLFLNLFKKRIYAHNRYLNVVWIVPILTLMYSIYFSSGLIKQLHDSLEVRKNYQNRNSIIAACRYAASNIRQWYFTNSEPSQPDWEKLSLEDFSLPAEDDFALYTLEIENDGFIVKGVGKKVNPEGEIVTVNCKYNLFEDEIEIFLLNVLQADELEQTIK
jgi:hypothetical protein